MQRSNSTHLNTAVSKSIETAVYHKFSLKTNSEKNSINYLIIIID